MPFRPARASCIAVCTASFATEHKVLSSAGFPRAKDAPGPALCAAVVCIGIPQPWEGFCAVGRDAKQNLSACSDTAGLAVPCEVPLADLCGAVLSEAHVWAAVTCMALSGGVHVAP